MSKQWNSSMQFPQDSDYILRVNSAEFGESKSSGNPMITLDVEVISPNEKEVGGEMITVAGTKPQNMYLTTKSIKKPDSTENLDKSKEKILLMNPELKSIVDSMDPDNVSQALLDGLKGACFFAVVYSKPEPRRKSPTQAQVEEAKTKGVEPVGDIMKNPITGEPLNYYKIGVGEIFGPAPKTAGANKPF